MKRSPTHRQSGKIKRAYLRESARLLSSTLRQLDQLFQMRSGQVWIRNSDNFRYVIQQIDYDLTHPETCIPLVRLKFDTKDFNDHATKFYHELLAEFTQEGK